MRTVRKALSLKALAAGVVLAAAAGGASAADILCESAARNHMLIDDSQVSACLAAGVGNINGNLNGTNGDPFLQGVGSEYELISKSDDNDPFDIQFTQDNGTGTWSFLSSAWDEYDQIAIGFQFGTGNEPDEWFVYSVADGVSSGEWEFVNVFGTGGGLSHVNLYGIVGTNQVPEPAGAALFGIGALGLAAAARRKRRAG